MSVLTTAQINADRRRVWERIRAGLRISEASAITGVPIARATKYAHEIADEYHAAQAERAERAWRARQDWKRDRLRTAVALRDSGMIYRVIGERLGVSHERARQFVIFGRQLLAREAALVQS